MLENFMRDYKVEGLNLNGVEYDGDSVFVPVKIKEPFCSDHYFRVDLLKDEVIEVIVPADELPSRYKKLNVEERGALKRLLMECGIEC